MVLSGEQSHSDNLDTVSLAVNSTTKLKALG